MRELDLTPMTSGGPVELKEGTYVVAIADTTSDDRNEAALPVTITGDVLDGVLPAMKVPPVERGARTHRNAPTTRRCAAEDMYRRGRSMPTSPMTSYAAPPPVSPNAKVGDTRSIHVLQPDNSLPARPATLRFTGAQVNVWVDTTTAPDGGISDADVVKLAGQIEGTIIPRVTGLFGPASDVDTNGRIDIFVTSALGSVIGRATAYNLFGPQLWGGEAYDFGENIYVAPPTPKLSMVDVLATVAHELQHMIQFGRRLKPYYSTSTAVPMTMFTDVYVNEGLAEFAAGMSGLPVIPYAAEALRSPEHTALSNLFLDKYLETGSVQGGYGFGSLFVSYLYQQAGGGSLVNGLVEDRGGRVLLDQIVDSAVGPGRLSAHGGRTVAAAYVDLAGALLVSSLPNTFAKDARYSFTKGVLDPIAGGMVGVPFFHEDLVDRTFYGGEGALLEFDPWSKRSQMRHGGMAFFRFAVGAARATVTVTSPTTTALVAAL